MSKKAALGRGIGAILGDVEEAYKNDIQESTNHIKEIELSKIFSNPYQPRTYFNEEAIKELSESIKRHGLLQPIIVVEKDEGYMLIAGERRLRASKLAETETIKAIVADIQSENLREIALIENIQRENLNPIELANAYNELIGENNITHEELSKIIHKSRAQITNTLRLLSLGDKTKAMIFEGKLSQGHAKVMAGLDKKDEETILNTTIGQKLSVRETEDLIKKIKKGDSEKSGEKKAAVQNLKLLENVVDSFQKIGLKAKKKNDSISIKFKSDDEIKKFLKKFNMITN